MKTIYKLTPKFNKFLVALEKLEKKHNMELTSEEVTTIMVVDKKNKTQLEVPLTIFF